jgi:predicted ATPase
MAIITKIELENWKSYNKAELHVDPLSILIGTNAGGKSNALDALVFLNRIATNSLLTSAIQGDGVQMSIRGGLEWAPKQPSTKFTIGATIKVDESTDYKYSICCEIHENRCEVSSEDLVRMKYRHKKDGQRGAKSGEIKLFRTDPCDKFQPNIVARLYNEKQGTPRQLSRSLAVLAQLIGQKTRLEIQEGVNATISSLRGIFILDPIPSHMRGFSHLSDRLEPGAGNIAGVIAAFTDTKKIEFQEAITSFIKHLPEKEIKHVYAEAVGKFKNDAMLYCEENWVDNGDHEIAPIVDARGMSDGTLRFLAILTALLTRPENSLLVIEEVDNGLHPSRASLLLKMLIELGKKRNVDVLITTHNPALLDQMGTKMVPFITVVHRNPVTGSSKLSLLEEISQLPKLLSVGTVGKLSSSGLIEKVVRNPGHQLTMDF